MNDLTGRGMAANIVVVDDAAFVNVYSVYYKHVGKRKRGIGHRKASIKRFVNN